MARCLQTVVQRNGHRKRPVEMRGNAVVAELVAARRDSPGALQIVQADWALPLERAATTRRTGASSWIALHVELLGLRRPAPQVYLLSSMSLSVASFLIA